MRLTPIFFAALVATMVYVPNAAAQFDVALVADIYPGSDGGAPRSLSVYDGRLFFAADDGTHGRELWAYDATTDEARMVADINAGSDRSMPVSQGDFTEFDGRLFFTANDGTHGYELWAYDHITDETQLVADIYPGDEGSAPGDEGGLLVHGDRLFFDADDGIHGRELWAYDAETNEASIVADINPGSSESLINSLTIYDGALYFSALGEEGFGLWKYDGLDFPTVSAEDAIGLTVYEDRLYFVSYDPPTGAELWAYDAATGESGIVVDINPGSEGSGPGGLTVYAGRLFFGAEQGESGRALWVFDAATDEATVAADVSPSSRPGDLLVYNDWLLFGADDGEHGSELWSYRQASGDATLVADIYPGAIGSFSSGLTVYDEQVFFRADDGVNGSELWTVVPVEVTTEDAPALSDSPLLTVYPNPSVSVASVELTMAGAADANVVVFDVLGRWVAVLHDGPLGAGVHRLRLDAAALPAGVYVVRATAGNERVTRKLVVAR